MWHKSGLSTSCDGTDSIFDPPCSYYLGMTEFSELTCDDVHVISFLNKVEGEAVALNCSASTETNIENKLIEALCNDFLLSGRVAPSDVSAKIEVGSSVFILCAWWSYQGFFCAPDYPGSFRGRQRFRRRVSWSHQIQRIRFDLFPSYDCSQRRVSLLVLLLHCVSCLTLQLTLLSTVKLRPYSRSKM